MKLEVITPSIDVLVQKYFPGQETRIAACKRAIERDSHLYQTQLNDLLRQLVMRTINHVMEGEIHTDMSKESLCKMCGQVSDGSCSNPGCHLELDAPIEGTRDRHEYP